MKNFFIFFFRTNIYLIGNFCLWYGTLPLPTTPVMYAIISLHDHILVIICLILALVVYLLYSTLFEYIYVYDNIIEDETIDISDEDDINKEEENKFLRQYFFFKTYFFLSKDNKFLTDYFFKLVEFQVKLKKIYKDCVLYLSYGVKPFSKKGVPSNVYGKCDLIKESI